MEKGREEEIGKKERKEKNMKKKVNINVFSAVYEGREKYSVV